MKLLDSEEDDPQSSFFKSILPTIKTFTNEQFLDFQVGVLQVDKNIKNQTAPSQVPPNSQWPYQ